ncbi:MAG: hypothetical protein CXX80_02990 [Methanobacteriota archaeon]|nr:MAG: hypothetical protein CXX80_10290 [Euryarchaeota archaeon]PXY75585.1 MAG: hypothetical protein CXX80_04540 [Euryarchaeota archaeon]PXY76603.1 MAG: hypothetical protein CXX80_02990 [Euryarchaeota archaeon]
MPGAALFNRILNIGILNRLRTNFDDEFFSDMVVLDLDFDHWNVVFIVIDFIYGFCCSSGNCRSFLGLEFGHLTLFQGCPIQRLLGDQLWKVDISFLILFRAFFNHDRSRYGALAGTRTAANMALLPARHE